MDNNSNSSAEWFQHRQPLSRISSPGHDNKIKLTIRRVECMTVKLIGEWPGAGCVTCLSGQSILLVVATGRTVIIDHLLQLFLTIKSSGRDRSGSDYVIKLFLNNWLKNSIILDKCSYFLGALKGQVGESLYLFSFSFRRWMFAFGYNIFINIRKNSLWKLFPKHSIWLNNNNRKINPEISKYVPPHSNKLTNIGITWINFFCDPKYSGKLLIVLIREPLYNDSLPWQSSLSNNT